MRTWRASRMQPDPNAESGAGDVYRITSLYYDTDDFDVFHRRGSFGRSKYRVRRYDSSQRVFLERKLRNESIVTKRRTRVDIGELDRLAQADTGRRLGGLLVSRAHAGARHESCLPDLLQPDGAGIGNEPPA